jgi:DNA-binding transcriptional LysR family regulator
MHHFDIDDLATVVAVSNRASFSAAAKDLNKTQAAISFAIAQLEQRLDHRLFERSPKGVRPTVQGEILITFARRFLALESEALEALSGAAPRGRVRIGMPDDYLDAIGAPAIEQFTLACPGVQVDITCDFSRRLETLVASGDLDLAIVTRGPNQTLGTPLWQERQIWCAAETARPDETNPLPLALFSDQCRARPTILHALEQAGRAYRIAYSFSHLSGILTAVERGRAVTVLPESSVPPNLRRLGLESGLPPLPPLELALLLPEGARAPARKLGQILLLKGRGEDCAGSARAA